MILAVVVFFGVMSIPAYAEGRIDVDRINIEISKLPPDIRGSLQGSEVNDLRVEVVKKGGYVMISDRDAWVVYQAKDGFLSGSGRSVPAWSAGICAGKFGSICRVGNSVEWWAENSCSSAPPSSVYEHNLRSTLRQSGGWFGLRRYNVEVAYAPYAPYSSSLTAFGSKICGTSDQHDFDQVVRVRVHSIDFGPKVSESTTLKCDALV